MAWFRNSPDEAEDIEEEEDDKYSTPGGDSLVGYRVDGIVNFIKHTAGCVYVESRDLWACIHPDCEMEHKTNSD